MSKPNSHHKIGYIEFLPIKQEYELVKKDWKNERSQRFFLENQTDEEFNIYIAMMQQNIILISIIKDCGEKRIISRNG